MGSPTVPMWILTFVLFAIVVTLIIMLIIVKRNYDEVIKNESIDCPTYNCANENPKGTNAAWRKNSSNLVQLQNEPNYGVRIN